MEIPLPRIISLASKTAGQVGDPDMQNYNPQNGMDAQLFKPLNARKLVETIIEMGNNKKGDNV
jgi:hypothetical protein